MAIITTVYSDCCNETAILCTNEDVDCHLKKYGIHCCNAEVKNSIGLFAIHSVKIVRLVLLCVVPDVYVHYFLTGWKHKGS